MKKIMLLMLAAAMIAALFLSCQKQSDERKSEAGSENAASEKADAHKAQKACEDARKENTSAAWERYRREFFDGECAEEAERFFCDEARHTNSRIAWEAYLRDFPNGKCAEEGKTFKNKYKITGGLEWSDSILTRSNLDSYDDQYGDTYVSWKLAKRYCEELKEDDQEDWRLPTVEELKMLVENCSGDSEKEGECLYSKMQGTDEVGLWGYSDEDSVWYANTKGIQEDNIYSSRSVRCVRQDERETCEAARKYSSKYLWHFYFENFPEGECISDARIFLEKSMCEDARKKNTRAAWEAYLRNFPNGKCAKEGKSIVKKYRKIGGLEWSDIFYVEKDVYGEYLSPDDYCERLIEGEHDDWRLPTIDELRALVHNHPGTVRGGLCRISENDGKTWIDLDENSSCYGIEGNNFSKLGDDVQLFSSTIAWMLDYQSGRAHPYWSWFLDFTNGAIVYKYTRDYIDLIGLNFRCVRQDDLDACKAAREESTEYSWENYLDNFPEGKCAEEAKAAPKEDAVCARARKLNTRAAWEKYLKKFPEGKCAKEGKAVRNKFKRIGTIEWSDILEKRELTEETILDCENLVEDGHSDWRLPNINELKTLIINNPDTVVGSTYDFDDYNSCEGEGLAGSNNCSKLGDTDWLMSYSSGKKDNRDKFWAVYFGQGLLRDFYIGNIWFDMRCVRQSDHDACETAKKYNEFYYWKHYFENYPNGECVKEAKTALKKLEEAPCKSAGTDKDSLELENYLRDFPNGKCAKEAKDKLDKEACEFARQENKYLWWWKTYLENFPGGKCAKEAENSLENMDQKACEYAKKANTQESWNYYLESLSYPVDYRVRESWDYYLENFPKAKCIAEAKAFFDQSTCEKAREENNLLLWKAYLKEFPEGQCAAEAKETLEKLSCEEARKENDYYDWERYLKDYPNGKCIKEAKAFLDIPACEKAKERNTRAAWELYLRDFPDGKCAEAAKAAITKSKKGGKLEWSNISEKVDSFEDAADYCKQLKEDGHSDWRLPNIDELRTLIKNCPKTETGGECKLSEKNNCLSSEHCVFECCKKYEACDVEKCACSGCEENNDGYYSKLGDDDHVWLWSSSRTTEHDNICERWGVYFGNGKMADCGVASGQYVRCVR